MANGFARNYDEANNLISNYEIGNFVKGKSTGDIFKIILKVPGMHQLLLVDKNGFKAVYHVSTIFDHFTKLTPTEAVLYGDKFNRILFKTN